MDRKEEVQGNEIVLIKVSAYLLTGSELMAAMYA